MKKFTAYTLVALLLALAVYWMAPAFSHMSPSSIPSVSKKTRASFLQKGSSFLHDPISLEATTFVPYEPSLDTLPETEKLPAFVKELMTRLPFGQLQKEMDGHDMTALVYNWSYPVPKDHTTDPFYDLFQEKKSSDKALQSLNQRLSAAEPVGNTVLKQYAISYNHNHKINSPEDIFSISIRNTTTASIFNGQGFTFSTHLMIKSDDQTLPFYVKSYIWKKGNQYRLLIAVTADSEWKLLSSDMDQLAIKGMET